MSAHNSFSNNLSYRPRYFCFFTHQVRFRTLGKAKNSWYLVIHLCSLSLNKEKEDTLQRYDLFKNKKGEKLISLSQSLFLSLNELHKFMVRQIIAIHAVSD